MLKYYAAEKVYCAKFVGHRGMLMVRERGVHSAR